MRILQIFNRYTQVGGEELMVAQIGQSLRKFHEVDTFLGSTTELLGKSSGERLLGPAKAVHNWEAVRSLRSRQSEKKYDLWLVHNVFPGLSPSVYQTAQEQGVPVVQYLHNFRMSCANGFFLNHGEICTRCISGNFIPAFLTACWRDSRVASGLMAIVLARVRLMDVFGQVSRWIATSHTQKRLHERMGINGRKIEVIPHFMSKPEEPPPYKKDGNILFLGRLSMEKGIHTLLKAWKRLDESSRRLVIAGTGPEEAALKAYCTQHALKNVDFVGFIPHHKQRPLWEGTLALAVPSIWYETFGTVVLQAWSHARPALVSDIGGLGEFVTNGSTGHVFAPEDDVRLAGILRQLISNPGHAEAMGKRGYEKLIRELSEEVWLTRINSVLSSAL
ncbi:MAG: glycosyltransferase family 4 protein [Verrucomicrobia bacterium]|nr:glycosyltransferase family 4 protein [Verrucomicrobiota bacterium]